MSASGKEAPGPEAIAHLDSEHFDEAVVKALGDEVLRGALRNATELFSSRRSAAVASLPDWEDLRERARAIKEETLANLDAFLEEFAANAEREGVQVHWARDAAEACEVVLAVARATGATTAVKSKSMTTEEIGLNDALERGGLLPVETDLGEWIIQLAGETPSHIIVPAIHKTKAQIAELFVEKLGIPPTDDVTELTLAARRVLRETFAQADLGISGVNFGIAETGSFLVLENEGNARMTTSLPRAHIAVMGIEKVIPLFEDLEVFLRLLPRSGTGQHLTSYQTIFTGPRREGREGPEELHLLIVDNGRSAMLRERVTRQSLACIRCGACLNACPVYQQIGGHAYGSVYPGPIGAVITPQLAGLDKAAKLPFASSLCGACRDVCPVKIDIPQLLLHLRARIVLGDGPPGGKSTREGRFLERLAFRAWAWAMAGPRRYRFTAWVTRIVQPVVVGDGRIGRLARRLVPPLGAWTAARELRAAAPRSFRAEWRRTKGKV
ncbi:MAG: iron-sulfur cluster-binding protein [Planctomycetota bacterium]|nr:MAG: iron-sulfur cluster-binding protein [Planctomycetota bacterium]